MLQKSVHNTQFCINSVFLNTSKSSEDKQQTVAQQNHGDMIWDPPKVDYLHLH